MKLDGSAPLVSANAADIVNLLSPKFTLIGTILAAVGLALLGQYSSLTKNLEALQFLKADIESTTRETLAGGTLDSEFIIEVYDARDEFNISVSDCRLHYYRLSTTSSLSYPVAVARLRWSIRAAKKDGRALEFHCRRTVKVKTDAGYWAI